MRATLLPAALAAAIASPLHAQDAAPADSFDLGTLYVSGGSGPLRFGDHPRSASVVTADEIAARGIGTVREALTALPGVSVATTQPSFAQIRIRGGEAGHALVLIDGVEAAAGDGEYVLSGLSTDNVERIEVLRGPQSVFYGSDAASGVVNIVTRTAEPGTAYGGRVEVGEGHAVSAYLTRRDARGGVALGLSDRRDAGYDLSDSGGDDDGIERTTITAKGDYEVAPGLTFGAIFRRSDEDYDYDGTDGNAATARGYVVDADLFSARDETIRSLWAEHEMAGGVISHRLAWERTDNAQSYGDADPTDTETRSFAYTLSLGLDGQAVDVTRHQLNLLLEDQEDRSSSEPDYDRSRRSVALEYRGRVGATDLQAGLRRDFNDPFEDRTTYTVAASHALTPALRLHASAGRGVVDPDYGALYYDREFFGTRYRGNPGLTPETNDSVDIGVELTFADGRGLVDATYFAETLEGEIVTVPGSPTLVTYVNEQGESDRQGLEIEARWQATDALSLTGAFTYLDAENPDGSVETRRPRRELGLGASYVFADDRARLTGSLRHVDGLFGNRFFGDFAQGVELDSFTVVDMAARYEITPAIAATGRVENLFDESYSEVLGYERRGRAFHAGLAARF